MTLILIRTIHPDGRVSLNQLAFSQYVALKASVPADKLDAFERQKSVTLPDGRSIKECDPEVLGIT
jgi:hypothetical protein